MFFMYTFGIFVVFLVGALGTKSVGVWSGFDVFVPHICDNIDVYEQLVQLCCQGNPTLIMRHSGQG